MSKIVNILFIVLLIVVFLPCLLVGQELSRPNKTLEKIKKNQTQIILDTLSEVLNEKHLNPKTSNFNIPQDTTANQNLLNNISGLGSSHGANASVVVPPSPSSLQMINSVNHSVNLYNGKLNTKVDIYGLKNNDLSVPIYLGYNGGGVTVDEYGSEVGQSWSLKAGGSITRIINGVPDEGVWFHEGPTNTFPVLGFATLKNPPNISGPLPYGVPADFENFENQDEVTQVETIKNLNWYTLPGAPAFFINDTGIDGLPDDFYFEFPGYAGKFVFDTDGSIHQIPNQNLKIIPTYLGGVGDRKIVEFSVTTPEGTIYTFGNIDMNGVEESKLTTTTLTNKYFFKYFGSFNIDDPSTSSNDQLLVDGFHTQPVINITNNNLGERVIDNYRKEGNSNSITHEFYTSTWKLTKIRSGKTSSEINFDYIPENDIHYIAGKNYRVDFPNFAIAETGYAYDRSIDCEFGPNNRVDLDGSIPCFIRDGTYSCWDNQNSQYGGNNELSSFHYSIDEIDLRGQRLWKIESSNDEELTFNFGAERNDMPNAKRIGSILLEYKGVDVKKWNLEYSDYNNEPSLSPFVPTNTDVLVSSSTEMIYELHKDFNNRFPTHPYLEDGINWDLDVKMYEFGSFLWHKIEDANIPQYDLNLRIAMAQKQIKSYKAEHNRFFLDRVVEIGLDGNDGDELLVANFQYENPEALPKRFSAEQDESGYFNQNNRGTLIPSVLYKDQYGIDRGINLYSSSDIISWIGWDEITSPEFSYLGHKDEIDASLMKTGALKTIIHRTGLQRIFSYGPNRYDDDSVEGYGLRIENISITGSGVNSSQSYDYRGGILMNSPIRRNQDSAIRYKYGLGSNTPYWEQIVTHSSGSMNSILLTNSGRVGYSEVERAESNAGSSTFFFTTPSSIPNEDLENPDHFPNITPALYEWDTYGSVSLPGPFSYTEASLITDPSYRIPFPRLEEYSWKHGLVKKVEHRNASGSLVQVTNNRFNYDTPFEVKEIWGMVGMRTGDGEGFPILASNYRGGKFKYTSSSYNLAESTTTTYYPDGGNTTKTTSYLYNEDNNVTNELTNFSNGQSSEIRYRYPANFNDVASQEMVARHIVSMPLETKVIQDNVFVGGEKTTYILDGDNIVPRKFYEAKEGAFRIQGLATDWNSDGNITIYKKAKVRSTGAPTGNYFPATTYTWDNDRLKSITYQQATIANYDYNDKRLLEKATDHNGVANLYFYDGFNRLSKTISNNNRVNKEFTYSYQPFTVSSDITYPDESTPQTELITMDGLGRSISVEQSGRLISSTTYDGAGRMVGSFEIGSGGSEYAYEQSVIGRLLYQIDGAGNKISYDYGVGGDLGENPFDYVLTTDANEHSTKSISDAFGLQEGIIDAIGGKTINGYDGFNRLITVAPPLGENYSFSYTPDNLLRSKTVPGEGETRFVYDRRYRLVLTQDPAGTKIATQFDNFDRPIASGTYNGEISDDNYVFENTIFPDEELSTIEYTGFYVTGGSEKIINANGSIGGTLTNSITPDDLGRPLFIEQGTVVGLNKTEMTYDDTGLLRTRVVTHGGPEELILKYEYTPDELLRPKDTRLMFDNKNILLSRITYSAQDQVSNRALHANASEDSFLQNISYSYDGGGRLVKINDLTEQVGGSCFVGELCNYEVKLEMSSSDFLQITNIVTQEGEQPININYNNFFIKEESPGALNDGGLISAINEWIFEEGFLGEASLIFDYDEDEGYSITLSILNTNLLLERILFNKNGQFAFDRLFDRGNCCDVTEEPVDDSPGTPGASSSALFTELITYTGHDITKIGWQATCESGFNTYDFTYDPLHRLKQAKHRVRLLNSTGLLETHTGRYNMEANYDAIGNITGLLRFGMTGATEGTANFGIIDQMIYNIEGNQVKSISDFANAPNKGFPGSGAITYDQAGRMTTNNGRGLTIDYNLLNLPRQITHPQGVIENNYTSSGTKVSKVAPNSEGEEVFKEYAGEFAYTNGEIESIFHADGRLVKNDDDKWEYEYVIRDHLGSTRILFADKNEDGQISENEILHENHYYPFGLKMEGNWTLPDLTAATSKDLDYQYTGKELNRGAGMIDYGARWLDPAIGRWSSVDPLAHWYYSSSPYAYVENDPISYNDPTGMFKSRFAAWLYKSFNGGGQIEYSNDRNEYFVGTQVYSENAATYKRVFSGDQSKPSGGLLNTIDFFPSGLGYAGKMYSEAMRTAYEHTDIYGSISIRRKIKHKNKLTTTVPLLNVGFSTRNGGSSGTFNTTYTGSKLGNYYESRMYVPADGKIQSRHLVNIDDLMRKRFPIPKGIDIQADLGLNLKAGDKSIINVRHLGVRAKTSTSIISIFELELVLGAKTALK